MRPNWFIGLVVPAAGWFDGLLADAPRGVRRFSEHDLHITLAFLGGVTEGAAQAAWDTFAGWTPGALTLDFGPIDLFGGRRPGAFAITLHRPPKALVDGFEVPGRQALEVVGKTPRPGVPRPHCTVARVGRRVSGRARDEAIEWALALPTQGHRITVADVALYTWTEDRSAQLFKIVDSRSLQR